MAFFGLSKPRSLLGIDIGTSSIKVVELSREGGRFKLENYGLFELESMEESVTTVGSMTGSRPAHLSDLDIAWGIKEVLKRSKISARDAVASIPTFTTFATIITMPYLSQKDMAQSIQFEARKYVPLPLNEVVLDWSIINIAPSGNNQQPTSNVQSPTFHNQQVGSGKLGAGSSVNGPPTVEVFLVAVPKVETGRYQFIAQNSGVNLRALELENSALIRSLVGNDLSPTAIVNIGGRSTSILIVDGGFERVSHNYEVGGFEVTKSISRSLNISLKRAEELKRSFGIKDVDNNVIQQSMSSLLDMMAFETKKTMHNYEDSRNVKIGKVILVGGLANMPNFINYFSQKLGSPVIAGNPLARVITPPGLEKLHPEISASFPIAIGLAMREI